MLSKEDNETPDSRRPRHADGQPAAPLLDCRRCSPPSCRSPTARRCACACWAKTSSPSATRPASVGLFAQRLPAPRRIAVLRTQRGGRPALRLPRLEVRHDRRLHRHAVRARRIELQEQGARRRLPHARVGRHRLDLHGTGGQACAVPRLRLRRRPAGAVARHEACSRTATGSRRWRATSTPSHISFLHRNFADRDVEDDGTDVPGYSDQPACRSRIWAHDRAPRVEVQDTAYGYRYAGIRTTPNGYDQSRMIAYVLPVHDHGRVAAGGRRRRHVRADRRRHLLALQRRRRHVNAGSAGGGPSSVVPVPSAPTRVPGLVERVVLPENDYLIDRDIQRDESYTGILGVVQQDLAVTESMGTVYDRTSEHLGTTDKAIIRMREHAAQGRDATSPPASSRRRSTRLRLDQRRSRREDPRPGRRLAPAGNRGGREVRRVAGRDIELAATFTLSLHPLPGREREFVPLAWNSRRPSMFTQTPLSPLPTRERVGRG